MLNTSPHGKSDFYAYAVGSSSWNVRSPQPIVHVRTADGTRRENPDYVSIVSITALYPLQKIEIKFIIATLHKNLLHSSIKFLIKFHSNKCYKMQFYLTAEIWFSFNSLEPVFPNLIN